MEKIAEILKEIFPSKEMVSYLASPFGDNVASPEKPPLNRHDMADIIVGAPIPLVRKHELFLLLAKDEDTPYFSDLAAMYLRAIQEMQLKPGEFFYMIANDYREETESYREYSIGAFLSWDHIFEGIEDHLCGEPDDDDLTWFSVEKWTPAENGRLKCNCTYTVMGKQVCFCDCTDFSWYEHPTFVEPEPNLPVPFHAGDILTVDCRPFAPLSHVVVLEIGDNWNCCCFTALHREKDSIWKIGEVKHSHVFPSSLGYRGFSPLYRLASFHGQLPEGERLLEQVSRYINGEEARGAALWNHIYQISKEDQEVTKTQILDYITGEGDTTI